MRNPKINTSLIRYNDTCYVPKNIHTEHYGYTIVKDVTEDYINLEVEGGQYLSLTAQHLKDMGVDFVHKDSWIRNKKVYFLE